MFYKRIILLLLVLCSLTGCANFNTDLDELYSKTYTVRFWGKGPDGRKKLSLLEDPSIDINSLTVYHEDYPNRKITQFHSGDKITIYYKDSNFKEIAKCTVNKAESVAIYFEIYHKSIYEDFLDKNCIQMVILAQI